MERRIHKSEPAIRNPGKVGVRCVQLGVITESMLSDYGVVGLLSVGLELGSSVYKTAENGISEA